MSVRINTINDEYLDELKQNFIRAVDVIKGRNISNPFLPGDWVEIDCDIKDAYGEVWHKGGSQLQIKSIAKDGDGIMFSSDLGIHWTHAKRINTPE